MIVCLVYCFVSVIICTVICLFIVLFRLLFVLLFVCLLFCFGYYLYCYLFVYCYSYSHPPRHTYYTIILTGERKQTTPIFNPGLIVKCIITLRIFYCVIFVHFNFLIRYRKCLVRSVCSKLYPPGRDSRGRDCMVAGYTTTYSISSYHH